MRMQKSVIAACGYTPPGPVASESEALHRPSDPQEPSHLQGLLQEALAGLEVQEVLKGLLGTAGTQRPSHSSRLSEGQHAGGARGTPLRVR